MNQSTLVKLFNIFVVTLLLSGLSACDETEKTSASTTAAVLSKGIGPITEIKIYPGINQQMAAKGKAVFESKCTACHKIGEKYIGPALVGVTKRRSPEWVMNMILNPSEMITNDETAKALLAEYMTQMANQSLTKEEARSVLEYFRSEDEKIK